MPESEEAVIREMRRIFSSPPPPEGIGDDAALLADERLVVSTDIMFESSHFPGKYTERMKGYAAAAANISDIAAMGAVPVALLVAMGIPADLPLASLRKVAEGMHECASRYGTEIIGGDTKSFRELTICITAIGRVEGQLLLRKNARPGQLVGVTGSLGRAAAFFLKRGPPFIPEPRVREGIMLSKVQTPVAATDITDGLAVSASNIARSSDVKLRLDAERFPFSKQLSSLGLNKKEQIDAVMHYGGDYELLFTVDAGELEKLAGMEYSIVGDVVEGEGVYLTMDGRTRRVSEIGYDAFRAAKKAARPVRKAARHVRQ